MHITDSPAVDEITTRTEVITPAMAAAWLDAHENYRPIRPRRVALYAEDMRAGRWDFNEEAIVFGTDGKLVDGQHRLAAIVHTGMPRRMRVTRGAPILAIRDGGVARTPGDHLLAEGVQNGNVKAAVGRLAIAYEQRILHDPAKVSLISSSQVRDFVLAHQREMQDSASAGYRVKQRTAIGASPYAAFHFHANRLDANDISRFTDLLISGAGLDADDPILALRNWASARYSLQKRTNNEMTLFALTRAWNYWREGRPIRQLRVVITGKGASRTAFPVMA